MSHDLVPRGTLTLDGRAVPTVGPMRVYACGVTPYDVTHLGHASTFIWVDALIRTLRFAGYETESVRNITDVDDVLTAAARRAQTPYDEYAAVQQYRFDHDMSELGVRRPDREPRAHQFVGAVIRLAQGLLDRGAAYEADGSVYFRGATVAADAGLSDLAARELCREFGEAADDPAKEDPLDVPVWRSSGTDDPAWPSPWGPGRPGWHAECTAMVLCSFGPSVDIHAGGADLAFPHHAYEAAQAETLTGVTPFARAWMRVGTVHVDGAKMAKSTGNLVLVSDLLREHRPAAIRMLILDRPWRDAWEFSPAGLAVAEGRLDALHGAAGRRGEGGGAAAEAEIARCLLRDLDVSAALGVALESGGRPARVLIDALGLI